jgi:hypothetical protein
MGEPTVWWFPLILLQAKAVSLGVFYGWDFDNMFPLILLQAKAVRQSKQSEVGGTPTGDGFH